MPSGAEDIVSNWVGNVVFTVPKSRLFYPSSVEEVQRLVQEHNFVKAIGTRHSFTAIADSKSDPRNCLISLQCMNKVVELNAQQGTVTVEGGIVYTDLSVWLHDRGYALENMASLSIFSVAGKF